MKVLYAIQGTGNGHISRAREILSHLGKFCDFDVLISAGDDSLDCGFPVKYRLKGITLKYNSGGGIDKLGTFYKNNIIQFYRDLKQLPIQDYDLVINDFEPVSAWACKWRNVPIIAMSHQSAYRSGACPRPRIRNHFGEFLFRWYAPTEHYYGFHFQSYSEHIKAPLIRSEVRDLKVENGSFNLVYLPSYSNLQLLKIFRHFPSQRFEIFCKIESRRRIGNCVFNPADQYVFLEKLRKCGAVICGAGFELPSESIYLGKRLLAIPIRGQYEQECNAEALRKMGVAVMRDLNYAGLNQWFRDSEAVAAPEVPDTEQFLTQVFNDLNKHTFLEKKLLQIDLGLSEYNKTQSISI